MPEDESSSYVATLRAGSSTFDVDDFLRSHAEIKPEKVWHRGEADVSRNASETSGFNLWLGEADTAEELWRGVSASLQSHRSAVQRLREAGVILMLDIGAMIEVGDELFRKVKVPVEMLRLLSALEVELVVSAYLVGDGDPG